MSVFSLETVKSLVEQICEALTNAIIEGRLKPGQPLTEQSLQKEFGVSRTPIREALRILEAKGLVTVIPRKGAWVKQIEKKDIEETFPIRALLEGYAAKVAVERMTPDDLDRMRRHLDEMERSAEKNDFLSFINHHYDFHRVFIRASGNSVLVSQLENLLRKAIWFRLSFLYFHQNYTFSIKKHRNILQLFSERNKKSVESVVRGHIEIAQENFLAFLDQKKGAC